MPRYVEIDDVEVSDYVTVWDCNCSKFGKQTVMAVDDLQYLPTADVVPKSEYDAVVSALDNSTKEFLKLHDYYQEAKSEIEQIFEEIDKTVFADMDFFKNLKKKHTEEKT